MLTIIYATVTECNVRFQHNGSLKKITNSRHTHIALATVTKCNIR